jgi:hypothetical protein
VDDLLRRADGFLRDRNEEADAGDHEADREEPAPGAVERDVAVAGRRERLSELNRWKVPRLNRPHPRPHVSALIIRRLRKLPPELPLNLLPVTRHPHQTSSQVSSEEMMEKDYLVSTLLLRIAISEQ